VLVCGGSCLVRRVVMVAGDSQTSRSSLRLAHRRQSEAALSSNEARQPFLPYLRARSSALGERRTAAWQRRPTAAPALIPHSVHPTISANMAMSNAMKRLVHADLRAATVRSGLRSAAKQAGNLVGMLRQRPRRAGSLVTPLAFRYRTQTRDLRRGDESRKPSSGKGAESKRSTRKRRTLMKRGQESFALVSCFEFTSTPFVPGAQQETTPGLG